MILTSFFPLVIQKPSDSDDLGVQPLKYMESQNNNNAQQNYSTNLLKIKSFDNDDSGCDELTTAITNSRYFFS